MLSGLTLRLFGPPRQLVVCTDPPLSWIDEDLPHNRRPGHLPARGVKGLSTFTRVSGNGGGRFASPRTVTTPEMCWPWSRHGSQTPHGSPYQSSWWSSSAVPHVPDHDVRMPGIVLDNGRTRPDRAVIRSVSRARPTPKAVLLIPRHVTPWCVVQFWTVVGRGTKCDSMKLEVCGVRDGPIKEPSDSVLAHVIPNLALGIVVRLGVVRKIECGAIEIPVSGKTKGMGTTSLGFPFSAILLVPSGQLPSPPIIRMHRKLRTGRNVLPVRYVPLICFELSLALLPVGHDSATRK